MFNAFKYSKQLEEVGFSREQAEIQLQVITEIVEGDLATKQDLENLKTEIGHQFDTVIKELRHEVQQMEYRLTIKMGAFLAICFTTMMTVMRLWLPH